MIIGLLAFLVGFNPYDMAGLILASLGMFVGFSAWLYYRHQQNVANSEDSHPIISPFLAALITAIVLVTIAYKKEPGLLFLSLIPAALAPLVLGGIIFIIVSCWRFFATGITAAFHYGVKRSGGVKSLGVKTLLGIRHIIAWPFVKSGNIISATTHGISHAVANSFSFVRYFPFMPVILLRYYSVRKFLGDTFGNAFSRFRDFSESKYAGPISEFVRKHPGNVFESVSEREIIMWREPFRGQQDDPTLGWYLAGDTVKIPFANIRVPLQIGRFAWSIPGIAEKWVYLNLERSGIEVNIRINPGSEECGVCLSMFIGITREEGKPPTRETCLRIVTRMDQAPEKLAKIYAAIEYQKALGIYERNRQRVDPTFVMSSKELTPRTFPIIDRYAKALIQSRLSEMGVEVYRFDTISIEGSAAEKAAETKQAAAAGVNPNIAFVAETIGKALGGRR